MLARKRLSANVSCLKEADGSSLMLFYLDIWPSSFSLSIIFSAGDQSGGSWVVTMCLPWYPVTWNTGMYTTFEHLTSDVMSDEVWFGPISSDCIPRCPHSEYPIIQLNIWQVEHSVVFLYLQSFMPEICFCDFPPSFFYFKPLILTFLSPQNWDCFFFIK